MLSFLAPHDALNLLLWQLPRVIPMGLKFEVYDRIVIEPKNHVLTPLELARATRIQFLAYVSQYSSVRVTYTHQPITVAQWGCSCQYGDGYRISRPYRWSVRVMADSPSHNPTVGPFALLSHVKSPHNISSHAECIQTITGGSGMDIESRILG